MESTTRYYCLGTMEQLQQAFPKMKKKDLVQVQGKWCHEAQLTPEQYAALKDRLELMTLDEINDILHPVGGKE